MNPPPWGAPRAAYLLTAAVADNTRHDGVTIHSGELSAAWAGYDASAQRDILAALGAQTRLALGMLRDKLGVEIDMDPVAAAEVAACPAALAAGAAPECAHCREIIAKAMCNLQIEAYFRLGFAPAMIAAMCRQSCWQSADGAGTSPRH